MTTKVWMTGDLLDYRQWMKEELRDVIRQNYIAGVEHYVQPEDLLASERLLPAPKIMAIILECYEGKEDDYLAISVFNDFAIASVDITILDEHGNLIESGSADQCLNCPELWDMLPTVRVPSGTAITIQAVAMDCMGSIGVGQQRKTLGQEPR